MELVKGFQKLNIDKDMVNCYNVLVGQLDRNFRVLEDKIRELEQSNPMGTAKLVAGLVIINSSFVRADSIIMVTSQVDGGDPGFLRVQSRVNGTSFTIRSSSVTDTSTVGWEIIN